MSFSFRHSLPKMILPRSSRELVTLGALWLLFQTPTLCISNVVIQFEHLVKTFKITWWKSLKQEAAALEKEPAGCSPLSRKCAEARCSRIPRGEGQNHSTDTLQLGCDCLRKWLSPHPAAFTKSPSVGGKVGSSPKRASGLGFSSVGLLALCLWHLSFRSKLTYHLHICKQMLNERFISSSPSRSTRSSARL